MSQIRLRRVNNEIMKAMAELLEYVIKDPRISNTLVTVTRVDTTNDFRYTKIYVSIMDEEKRKEAMEALDKAKGMIRSYIGKNVQLRYTPEPIFVLDNSIEYAVDMINLIEKVVKEDEEKANE